MGRVYRMAFELSGIMQHVFGSIYKGDVNKITEL